MINGLSLIHLLPQENLVSNLSTLLLQVLLRILVLIRQRHNILRKLVNDHLLLSQIISNLIIFDPERLVLLLQLRRILLG